jgi:hypothetical protein
MGSLAARLRLPTQVQGVLLAVFVALMQVLSVRLPLQLDMAVHR